MQVIVMRVLLLGLLLPIAQCQWWGGGFRRPSNPFRHSHRSPLSSYSSYVAPEPEPEPEPLPRFTRRLSPSRPSSYRQLSSPSSSKRRISSFTNSRLPPLTATKTSTPRKTNIRASWNALSTRERVSKVKVKATKSPSVKKTKGPTVITARKPTKTTKSVRKTTAAPTSKTTEPARKRNLKVLSKTSINLLDSVFDEEVKKEEVTKGWVLPPSLMAVAAVPGAPVISAEKSEARVAKDVMQEDVDPYLQFMPVPAVPRVDEEVQAPRKPKESLTSLMLDLKQSNALERNKEAKASKGASKGQKVKSSKTQKTVALKTETALSNSVLFDDKEDARKKFKRCHGRCVQQFCLPVNDLNVYAKCVDKCKGLCT